MAMKYVIPGYILFCILLTVDSIKHDNNRPNQTPTHSNEIQKWVNSRVDSVEQRLNSKINYLNNTYVKMNHTLEISHLEKLFHMINEELEISEEKQTSKDLLIKDLQNTIAGQTKDIHHLKKRMGHLESTLMEIRKHFLGDLSSTDKMASVNADYKSSTTPAEINRPTENPGEESRFPRDCTEAYASQGVAGLQHTFVDIKPTTSQEQFQARCQINRDQGWTVIQRRVDGSVDFFRGWSDYKNGFGSMEGEFWIGLQKIYQITNQGDYKLRIEMTSFEGKDYWAEYDHFRVSDETDFYRLHVHGYHGNAGDSLTSRWENHNGQPFSTLDHDNDGRYYDNCASHYKGAWWFTSCFESHLNGIYYQKGDHNNYFVRNGIQWNTIHIHSSLRSVAMMLHPNHNVVEPENKNNDDDTINGIQ